MGKKAYYTIIFMFILAFTPSMLCSQPAPVPLHIETFALNSGVYDGETTAAAVKFRHSIQVDGASWLRVFFSDYHLGEHSFISITSQLDGETQRLDDVTLQNWNGSSAYFNGSAVDLELHVAPGDAGIFFEIREIMIGDPFINDGVTAQEICGTTDDRVASNDPAVGRIMPAGCTGWLISNGAGLTAGHCVGVNHVLQFNVPASLSDGTPVNPPTADQFPITAYTASANGGVGNDWAVFSIGPNNDGNTVVQRQASFYRMSIDLSPTTVRENGYGIDGPAPLFGDGLRNADSQTQQTHAGPFVSETIISPSVVPIRFQIDDENGNSGSPVIDATSGVTVGIATSAGCTATGGSNAGTGFENDNLEQAIQVFAGTAAEYVDNGHLNITENGTIFRPWDTVSEGIAHVSPGGVLSIVSGSYNEGLTITQPMIIDAPVGNVVIGN